MNRILIAVLLAAAPAFADRYDRPNDDPSLRQGDWSGGYDEEVSEAPPPDEGNYQPAEDPAYTEDRGPTFDDFRNDRELSWNGEWIDTGEYGRVWRPTRVSDDWQPYLYGRWVWTRAGWAWASDEPFGWAVYHYGRWAWTPSVGWMWVPGRTWAPAWVSWRWSDGYAAWCPLGPRSAVVDRPALWVVVPTRHFLEPVRHHVVPRPQRQALPLPSRPGPSAGPAVTVVERAIGRTVHPLAIGHAESPSAARAGSGSVDFYRPRTAPIAVEPRGGPAQADPRQQNPRAVRPYYGSPASTQEQPQPVRPHYGPPASTQEQSQPVRPYYGPPQGESRPGQGVGLGARQRPAEAQPPAQAPQAQGPRAQPPGQGPKVVIHPPSDKHPDEAHPADAGPHAGAPRSNPEQPLVKER